MRILFVCTGNTCRSPMAERLGRLLHPEHTWESAGVMPTGVMHPMTARVLDEHGADSDGFAGRDVVEVDLSAFDHLVLIGRTAQALSPDPPDSVTVHFWDVPDPYEVVGSETEILEAYQACAKDLKERIAALAVR